MVRRRDDPSSVWTERRGSNPARTPLEDRETVAGGGIPDARCAILRARNDPLAVPTKCHGQYLALVLVELRNDGPLVRVPNAHSAVGRSADHPLAIGTECSSSHATVMTVVKFASRVAFHSRTVPSSEAVATRCPLVRAIDPLRQSPACDS